jgi:hypothetical protein
MGCRREGRRGQSYEMAEGMKEWRCGSCLLWRRGRKEGWKEGRKKGTIIE